MDNLRQLLKKLCLSNDGSKAESVVEMLRKLDKYKEDNKNNLNPQLYHYLDQRSYAKALAFLDDPTLKHKP